jgi:hypothetical protein
VASYSRDGVVQDVNSLAGTELNVRVLGPIASASDHGAFKSSTGISSIAPFITNMKMFSYW